LKSAELIITWCMATTIQSMSRDLRGGAQLALEECELPPPGVAVDVDVAAVLKAVVVVLQRDHAYRPDREGVPQVGQFRVGLARGQREVRLERAQADRAVRLLDLMAARGGHPGAEARRARVVREEVVQVRMRSTSMLA
jgi:hypothetical protein